jgi:hypothetical protein
MKVEHELTPVVKSWLKGTKESPHTAQQTVGQVMKRLPETRQGRRRWSFPWPRRSASATPHPNAQEPQPTPIPVTNGRTPTVTGRTQFMFSPAKAITVGALVFAIGGAFLIAQPVDRQVNVPGAASDRAGLEPATVTGTVSGFSEDESVGSEDEGSEDESEGSIEDAWAELGFIRNDWEERAQLEMSDSRLTGTWTASLGIDRYSPDALGEGVAETYTGTVRVENIDGTWVGTQFGCSSCGRGAASDMFHVELVGTGAYEGLSALLYLQNPRINDDVVLYGVIFPGDIPTGQ